MEKKINFLKWPWKPSRIALASAQLCWACHKPKGRM